MAAPFPDEASPEEVQEVMDEMGFDPNILTPSEVELIDQGGYSVSESGITDRNPEWHF